MPIVETADLALFYDERGPASPDTVLLLHGWPDDASTWNEVANLLVSFFAGGSA